MVDRTELLENVVTAAERYLKAQNEEASKQHALQIAQENFSGNIDWYLTGFCNASAAAAVAGLNLRSAIEQVRNTPS